MVCFSTYVAFKIHFFIWNLNSALSCYFSSLQESVLRKADLTYQISKILRKSKKRRHFLLERKMKVEKINSLICYTFLEYVYHFLLAISKLIHVSALFSSSLPVIFSFFFCWKLLMSQIVLQDDHKYLYMFLIL